MNKRKRLSGIFGAVSLGVLAAIALAAGGASSDGPSLGTDTGVTAPPTVRPAKIIGRVTSADATADLSGVHVVLHRDGKPTQRTVTNDKGYFQFERVAPGRFGVAAAKKDVGGGREIGAVKPGDTARVQIELKKRPE